MTETLTKPTVENMRKASQAVYLACGASVADDISNLLCSAADEIDQLRNALEKIEYASRKDSLTDHERLQSVRTVVCAALSRPR